MTIEQAIKAADETKPNAIPKQYKMKWLSDVDEMIYRKLIKTHAGGGALSFYGYDMQTPETQLLFAVAPYDAMYVYYLLAQYDLWNNELDRYQNSAMLYNNTYSEYANHYNRTILPRRGPHIHF